MTLRQRVHAALEAGAEASAIGRAIDLVLVVLILANVTAIVLETVPELEAAHAHAFRTFENVSLAVFAFEYVARLWSCTADPRCAHPVLGRLRCALRPMMLIDLAAILPGILALRAVDLRMLRALRLLRLLRLLKLTRHSAALQMFGRILRSKAPELASTLLVMVLLLVMSSSLMYFLEHERNPGFSSIPAAMWWGIATFTTVGYGDLTPITPAGKVLGGLVALLGIAMFAIPAGVLGAAFSDELQQQRHRQQRERDDAGA